MKYLPFLDTFVTLASSCTYECCCYCSTLHSCPAVCYPMDYSMPGFPVLHHLQELAQIQVHWVGDAIQPSCSLSSPSTHWYLMNWWFWTVVLEKTLESPLDCKEIQPINPKRNQFWIFILRTDAEVEAPILWPSDANWLIGKDPDSGQDWRQEEKGTDRGWDGWMASLTQWTWV